jgi:hypothetical protein
MAILLLLLALGFSGVCCAFDGIYFSGGGDDDYLQLLDVSRRMWAPDAVYQSVPMLYSGSNDGLLEGPTWDAWLGGSGDSC